MPDWISRVEAARRLHCHEATIGNMIKRGELDLAPAPPDGARRPRSLPSIDADSVERLRQQRAARQAELEAKRQPARTPSAPPDDDQVWLSVSETAAVIGVVHATVRARIDAGRIPATRHDDRWWIRRQDVEVLANARRFRIRSSQAQS